MKNFYTAVVELRQEFASIIETHPYECGWADEAIFFVETNSAAGAIVSLRVQLSADGIRWIDEGTRIEVSDTAFARITHFGGFIRLAGTVRDDDGEVTSATVSVRLALKG